jgi:hypothetical protein
VSQFPWAKMLQGCDGEIEHVRCLIYSVMYRMENLLRTNIDNLAKHLKKN